MSEKNARIINWVLIFLASIGVAYFLYDKIPVDYGHYKTLIQSNPNAVVAGQILGCALVIFAITCLCYKLTFYMFYISNKQKTYLYPFLMAWMVWGIVSFIGIHLFLN